MGTGGGPALPMGEPEHAAKEQAAKKTELGMSSPGAEEKTEAGIATPVTEAPRAFAAQPAGKALRRLERQEWWLWGNAILVILLLMGGLVAVTIPQLSKEESPFFRFHLDQALRGLAGLVLIFNVFTVYQEARLKRMRSQLVEQMEIAAQEHARAEGFLKLAMLDQLTGLHNRRFAEERLAGEIRRSQRHGRALTVLLLDLNAFKQINDHYGHLVGDLVLKCFAERLNRAIRGSDLAVRWGGDEFMVMLPECQLGQVQLVLRRLQDLAIEAGGQKIPFTFSAGWTDYQPGESSDELLQRADHALYLDKRSQKTPAPAGP